MSDIHDAFLGAICMLVFIGFSAFVYCLGSGNAIKKCERDGFYRINETVYQCQVKK